MGPVTPLLALAEVWQKKSETKIVFVGTPNGPEREVVEKAGFVFLSLPKAKIPRYLSNEWLTFPWNFLKAFFAAIKIIFKNKKGKWLIVSAGGNTAVPMIFAGRLLSVRSWIHQQDVVPLLSNKVTAPIASLITVAWEDSLKDFPSQKTKLVGNPIRQEFLLAKKETAQKYFSLNTGKPTVLILGGGTGSAWLNEGLAKIGNYLVEIANVIHVTGKNKTIEELKDFGSDYHSFELLNEDMPLAFAAADLVICRAGMGTITELAATHKPAIVIPLPNSPQEDNAAILEDSQASIVIKQSETDAAKLLFIIRYLLADESRRHCLGEILPYLLKTNVAEEMVAMGEGVLGGKA